MRLYLPIAKKWYDLIESGVVYESIPDNGIITFTHTFGEDNEFVGDVVDSRWINGAYYDADCSYNWN